MGEEKPSKHSEFQSKNELKLFDFIVVGLMPILVGKTLVFYFGLNYSKYPGEGYGYGVVASLLFTLFSFARFIWKYRHYSE